MTTSRAAATRFDWRRFLDLAERLSRESDDEAALRTAISRAYYAAFALARRRLLEQGCWSPGLDPHTRTWATDRDAGSDACRRIGEKGFNLRDRRRRADYEDAIGRDPARRAAQAVSIARDVLHRLDRLDADEACCPPIATPAAPSPP